MRSKKDVEGTIRTKLNFTVDPPLRDRLLARATQEQKQSQPTKAALCEPVIGRMIMRNSIVKWAVAAVIVGAVVLGLFEFIQTGSNSGIVWAEVVQKVEASRGVTYRERHGTEGTPAGAAESDYDIVYLSPTQYRCESTRNGALWITMYDNRETGKRVALLHAQKGYVLEDMKLTEAGDQHHADVQDPTYWPGKFMACAHTKLKPREIDGTLCEGIETTDLALVEGRPEIASLLARLWVSVETGYPVRLEGEFHGQGDFSVVFDRFQWDVQFDADVFEPNIPSDYEQQ